MTAGDNSEYDLLFKAMLWVAGVAYALFAVVIFMPVFTVGEPGFLSYLIVVLFFYANLVLLCWVVFRMTVLGRNIFFIPLYLIFKLCRRDVKQLRAMELSPVFMIVLFSGITLVVGVIIEQKIGEKSLLQVLLAGLVYVLGTLCLWWQMVRKNKSRSYG